MDKESKNTSEQLDVDFDELDDKTRESLLGIHDPSKSTWVAKACDYVGYFSLLISLIALFRAHWAIFVTTLLIGFAVLFIGFLIQRNTASKQLRKYRKELIHKQVAAEALFIDDAWNLIIDQINEKRPLLATLMESGKIRPRKVVNNILVLSGDKSTYKHLRNRQDIDLLAQAIKDTTGEMYKIVYL